MNQPALLLDINAYIRDPVLRQGVAREGAAWAEPRLTAWGERTGSAQVRTRDFWPTPIRLNCAATTASAAARMRLSFTRPLGLRRAALEAPRKRTVLADLSLEWEVALHT